MQPADRQLVARKLRQAPIAIKPGEDVGHDREKVDVPMRVMVEEALFLTPRAKLELLAETVQRNARVTTANLALANGRKLRLDILWGVLEPKPSEVRAGREGKPKREGR